METPVKNAGNLFTQCRRRFGLEPAEVLGLLDFADADAMKAAVKPGANYFGDYEEVLESIEDRLTLRSGRVLRPEVGRGALEAELAEAERKAWSSLERYRFQEFGHYVELWASLHRIIGEHRKNPFSAVWALGRRRAKGS